MMARLLLITFLFICAIHTNANPVINVFRKVSATSAEGSWLWGWVWGAESTVSVVDRSPSLSYPARPAAFGPELDLPLLGYVIPMSSFTSPCPDNDSKAVFDEASNFGCPTLCVSGPHEPDPKESWIALVQRGHCPFVDKVREAQRLGARAVVVGGEDPKVSGFPDTLVNMYSKGDASDVTIPSSYITYSDFKELSYLIETSNTSHAGLRTLSLLISTQYSSWEWYSPIITFIVILILPSCLTFITLLIHRVRMARAAERDRAPQDMVKSLPWRVWTGTGWEKHEGIVPLPQPSSSTSHTVDLESGLPAEALSESTSQDANTPIAMPWFETQMECAICLSEFVKGDRVRELPCHHIFHLDEVDEWLINRKKLCPVCKADVTQPWNPNKPFPRAEDEGNEEEDEEEENLRHSDRPASIATERTPLLYNHVQPHEDS
ncbi:hypothetical protein SERLA73DRAFT_183556 [Serpula lacrymans var. lacrymans S7.3]|uniref:RING-type E3 ubiquitin transferase n=2 Tax=Serpula lacrymans var. lacrymans TaxID=341189 RepID=F8Q035_SERL3|nr:uncharacterized protein SERLADRAFT_470789 [Serpula lacrymans var. lacrymans S7.9]EGN98507.1 hypothetical protein SERLA73DRAFT_183556 [Serpula lacrymans var. lacrymans S7.3]EGO24081.1 hypothetical protein SERLADRAFT_470789 [Serpula lacrymans var. lacrymans S7.9]